MLTAMERDQFNEKRSNRLRDFILDDQDLLVELIESADLEVIKDLTRALQYSPCFDDMDKRSLLARIVKSYPTIQSLISGEQSRHETHFFVSWESLERRKEEYRELVEKKIPANSKEIALARSYGDLRENHEYKAAKEMQKLLMRRKAELENQLVRARGMDFANPRTDVVAIGTRVKATDLEANQPEQFIILGAWDSDPERGIVSYLSPIAQALLNRTSANRSNSRSTASGTITGLRPSSPTRPHPPPSSPRQRPPPSPLRQPRASPARRPPTDDSPGGRPRPGRLSPPPSVGSLNPRFSAALRFAVQASAS
jgi:transcription elongation GreA/GreB family factor